MAPHKSDSPAGSYTDSFSAMSLMSSSVNRTQYMRDPIQDGFETSSVESNDMEIRRPLMPGIYVPTVTFFKPITEDLDLETIASHAVRLAEAGVAGLTTQGSNGEAVHLSHRERDRVTIATRKSLDDAGFGFMPIIVGCGSQSTRETIELCHEAQAAGGDYALVLPPAYYKGLFNQDSVMTFFRDVASASPIPILIYNYPGAVSGIDLSSDAIIELAKHPNVVGCKLTCGNTGKLNRIAAATRAATIPEAGSGFMCMGGSADFILQTFVGGGSGCIGGLANVAPKACVKLVQLYEEGNFKEARKLQAIVARGDWAAIQGGLVGTKCAMQAHFGYGGFARKPLPKPTKDEVRRWREGFQELVDLEKSL
ncbi:dihydrodipicolinate synthase [Eremomyces bilateralis CBS 781.70]|uniref:Dihydrodipicolinate synthase n=1 Tax=Eremomyces bilateralis CBS 781.70 TaxID=1392243 RepID=A0A6G1FQU6_9PEZI|nr:dihydrodipicolinate synthase [Eremomyces bilateralis CBS 781.70]KAF1808205.1 dihydrodipicolinate synthase [Eremomyces bilateralis CBS 781.70]